MERMDRESLLEGLTEPQRQAVQHIDGPVLVLAGPGSGKTTVVTRRVANIIANGIPPWQILALTFTNKASGEMRERILRLLPPDLPGVRGLTISTFHSFCARLLRRYGPVAGLSERFSIYDSGDQREAMKLAIKEAGLDSKNWTPGSMASAISNAKNLLIDANEYAQRASDFQSRSIAKVYSEYQKILKKNDALDFDDLLVVTAKLLKNNQQVREGLQRRFQYILIDEYQDTNYVQFVMAHTLASAHKNICVVGDPDQSIYGWRGADIRNILEFEQHYPSATIIPLGQNFRSTAHIVATAAHLIKNNRKRKDKRLHTELPEGEKPSVITCFDEHHEARMIVEDFQKLHAPAPAPGSFNGEGVAWKDMAVLYRINAMSRVLEEEFRTNSIPYVIARGTAFYERKEIKDALAYLRVVSNPNDEVSLRRIINVPTRGIGSTTLQRIELFAINQQWRLFEGLERALQLGDLSSRALTSIQKFVANIRGWREAASTGGFAGFMGEQEKTPLADLVERIIKESGLEALYKNSKSDEDYERWENLNELISAAAEFTPPPPDGDESTPAPDASELTLLQALGAFLESVALVSDADAIDPANGAVTLMTLHAAKGLEFTAVALAGLEEGMLPHSRAFESDAELEEERRLCFVGITRAKRHLLISHANMRTIRGMRERTIPSQFLRELPEDSVQVLDLTGGLRTVDAFDDKDDEGGDMEWGSGSYKKKSKTAVGSAKSPRETASGAPGSSGRSGKSGGGSAEFPVGCLVQHPIFGLGRIEFVTRRASGSSAQVAFNSVGRKTLILEYAKLQRVQ